MKHLYSHYILMGLLLILFTGAFGNPADSARSRGWYVPHYLPIQFAGNIGFLSLGAGYNSNHKNYQLSILYGHVPSSLAHSDIHTLTVKNSFPLAWYPMRGNKTLIPYVGLGLTVEVGGNAFFKMPAHFPESYYDFPKNLHLIAYGGATVQHIFQDDYVFLRGVEFFLEGGTIDAYLWYKTISSQIRFHQIFSLALGVNLLLDY